MHIFPAKNCGVRTNLLQIVYEISSNIDAILSTHYLNQECYHKPKYVYLNSLLITVLYSHFC